MLIQRVGDQGVGFGEFGELGAGDDALGNAVGSGLFLCALSGGVLVESRLQLLQRKVCPYLSSSPLLCRAQNGSRR